MASLMFQIDKVQWLYKLAPSAGLVPRFTLPQEHAKEETEQTSELAQSRKDVPARVTTTLYDPLGRWMGVFWDEEKRDMN